MGYSLALDRCKVLKPGKLYFIEYGPIMEDKFLSIGHW